MKILSNMNKIVVAILVSVCFVVSSFTIVIADDLPEFTGRVVDNANLLSSDQHSRLTDVLADFEQHNNGTQIVIATIEFLDGKSQFDYSLQLFKKWEIGQKEKNNGVLLFISKNDRKISIRTGYGLEKILTDDKSKLIIQNKIAPAFRNNEFYAGIYDGLTDIMLTINPSYVVPDRYSGLSNQLEYVDSPLTPASEDFLSKPSAFISSWFLVSLFGMPIAVITVLFLWLSKYRRSSYRSSVGFGNTSTNFSADSGSYVDSSWFSGGGGSSYDVGSSDSGGSVGGGDSGGSGADGGW